LVIGSNIIGQATSFPAWFAASKPGCTTSEALGWVDWIVVDAGILIDILSVSTWDCLPQCAGIDSGVIFEIGYGCVHLLTAILASIGQKAITIAANVLPVIPELCKFLRLDYVIAASEGESLPVLGLIDWSIGGIGGLLLAITGMDN
jgi:hypothetical protein